MRQSLGVPTGSGQKASRSGDGKMSQPSGYVRNKRGCVSWIAYAFGGLVVLCLGVGLAGAVYQSSATRSDGRRYPPPGELVDVGGYRLHINCEGEGQPAVAMDSGLPGLSLDWALVQPDVAEHTRVCTYDRSGYGWSDPAATPRTSQQMAEELRTLLQNAGIAGPYVLVGHSFGGYNVRLFAASFPSDVAGMVLVDAGHEDERSRAPQEAQALDTAQMQLYGVLRAVAPLGALRLVSELGLDPLAEGLVAKLPSEVQPVWNALACRTGYVTTLYAEWSVLEDSEAQVRASGPVGDIPLVVLSSSTVDLWAMPPGYPLDELVALHMDLQRKLAALAPDSTHIVVEDSGHYIQLDQPQVVVDAILDVVEAARAE